MLRGKKEEERKEKKACMDWHAHALDAREVLKKLGSSESGLSEEEAKKRLKTYGRNEIKEVHKVSALAIFISQFNSFFVYLLFAAALISLLFSHWLDFYAILAIIILNASLGFVQNYKAEKAIYALKKSLIRKAKVIRENKIHEIDAEEVVPGDILLLEEGDKIVADARLLEVNELQCNEAALTGESLPVTKTTKALAANTALAERKNMVYCGTEVVGGKGKAVVVATAMQTEFGKIARAVQEVKKEKTPLQKKLDSFAKKFGIGIIALAFVIALVGIFLGIDKINMLLTSISLAVAAVPEGLPAVITITLAIAVKRMYKVNSLIRKLPAAESLGRVTVIATDKTGTITKEEMEAVRFFADDKIKGLEEMKRARSESDTMLLKIGVLCNNARMEIKEEDKGKSKGKEKILFFGDPTEQALLRSAFELGIDKKALEEKEVKIKEFPFSSARKMMSVIRKDKSGLISYVKGAPEVIISKSSYELRNKRLYRLNELRKRQLLAVYEQLAEDGLRVLAFAYKRINEISQREAEHNLVFVGFQGLLDPPRPEVKDAIKSCKEAGIEVKMITGDSAITARAIAREIGLAGNLLTGEEIDKLNDDELKEKLKDTTIFARVTPEHKLRIVSLLKQSHVVAVTGDGVNDAPALKKADIGIAMGQRGTDVARDVSDVVLVDDNFASIVNGVKEGRRVFDNIKKFSYYLISSNLAEIFIVTFALLFGAKLGIPMLILLPIQLLWINLVTDGIIAIALSFEGYESNVMKRKPESGELFNARIIAIWLLLAGFITAFTLLLLNLANGDAIKMSTIAFTALVFFEGFNALNFRSFREPIYKLKANWWLVGAIVLAFCLQLLILSLPFLHKFFGVTALNARELGLTFFASILVLVGGEIFKFALRKIESKKEK
jgi:Ca2+-transporting ATPase